MPLVWLDEKECEHSFTQFLLSLTFGIATSFVVIGVLNVVEIGLSTFGITPWPS